MYNEEPDTTRLRDSLQNSKDSSEISTVNETMQDGGDLSQIEGSQRDKCTALLNHFKWELNFQVAGTDEFWVWTVDWITELLPLLNFLILYCSYVKHHVCS